MSDERCHHSECIYECRFFSETTTDSHMKYTLRDSGRTSWVLQKNAAERIITSPLDALVHCY